MHKYLIVFLIGISGNAESRQKIIIAVVDTGYTNGTVPNLSICSNGLLDLTGSGMQDDIGHGTNILNIIAKELRDVPYCVYIYKVYNKARTESFYYTLLSYIYIGYLPHVDIINYSSSGPQALLSEEMAIKMLLHKNIIFVAAAGNNKLNLDKDCSVYPACYVGVTSVGALNEYGGKASYSNYGQAIKAWEVGDNYCFGGYCYSGTSQATAYQTTIEAKKLAGMK